MSMYFENWSGFWLMGGHGPYVWSAYAVALGVVVYNLLVPFLTQRQLLVEIRRQRRLAEKQATRAQETLQNNRTESRTERLNKDLESVRRSA